MYNVSELFKTVLIRIITNCKIAVLQEKKELDKNVFFPESPYTWKLGEFNLDMGNKEGNVFKWRDLEVKWKGYIGGKGIKANKQYSLQEIENLLETFIKDLNNYITSTKKQ